MTLRSLKRTPRANQRGVTLIELMVGFTIAILLTLAAVSFAAHETRLMGISRDRLDLAQASRAAIDLLAEDLKQAGAGIGYQADGTFAGLMLGRFTAGGLVWNPDGAAPTLAGAGVGIGPGVTANLALSAVGPRETLGPGYTAITTDIGIMTANGSYATIAEYNPAGAGMYCTSPRTVFQPTEYVVLRTQSSFDAFTASIIPGVNVACNTSNGHNCVNGCTRFTFAPVPMFSTDLGAQNRSYLGGEIAGAAQTIVWFAVATAGRGTLRRAVFNSPAGCAARNGTCGSNVVADVEAMLAQAWTFDPATGLWTRAGQVPIVNGNRIRVDVELVMRSRKSADARTMPVPLNLLPTGANCVPATGPCGEKQDFGQRRVIRTSIEIKNSGLMSLE